MDLGSILPSIFRCCLGNDGPIFALLSSPRFFVFIEEGFTGTTGMKYRGIAQAIDFTSGNGIYAERCNA